MNLRTTSNLAMKSTLVLALALMPISALAADQHKEESKGGSHPSQSHGGGQARSSGQGHAGGGGHAAGAPRENRGNQGRPQASRPGGTRNREGGNASGPGNAGNRGTVGGNRPEGNRGNVGNRGNIGGNRGQAGNRGGAANRGATAGNRGAVSHATRTVSLRGGGTASIRSNGQIRSINRNGMRITNNVHGGRTVISEHNNIRIVNRPGGGYVQRSYVTRGGRPYYARTYYAHGVYRTGIYRGYYYHGYRYYGYYPGFWYHPGFYGWAWHPWGVGLSWGFGVGGWGWAGSPWWGFYGGWWNPYPVYASPAFWLTDWLIAAELQNAYSSQYNTGAAADQGDAYPPNQGGSNYSDNGGGQANSQVTLSPEVKEAIAEEVKAQLAAQEQQAPTQGGVADQGSAAPANSDENQVPPALDPARRTFVVDNAITVETIDGQECSLTGGDVLTRLTDTPDANNQVNASVSASKKGECGAGKQVVVSVDDLQEMRNHFEEQLNNGMKELAAKQGTNGMPKAPDAGTVSSDIQAPEPDKDASKELSDQQSQADQAEQQAKQEAAGPGGGGQD